MNNLNELINEKLKAAAETPEWSRYIKGIFGGIQSVLLAGMTVVFFTMVIRG